MENQPTNELIDATVSSLNDGGVTSLVPTDGQSLISNWLRVLGDSPQTQQIKISLEELKSQLESGYPDPTTVRAILLDLAEQTDVVTNNADPEVRDQLRPLVDAIQQFGNAL
ncbi:hypothetical protein [Tellurirhabdus bombi]|uniref:hypothetical protein n=1 Tax=Tellurirhabdus bombi TaxID=2907205 RepID=UPI001F27849A|nr:hypothetical protein [Tellurirhabdus bombi]